MSCKFQCFLKYEKYFGILEKLLKTLIQIWNILKKVL